AFLPVVLLLLAASQLLAAQNYNPGYPYQNQNQNQNRHQGQQQYSTKQQDYYPQDVQIGLRFGGGLDAQQPIGDSQIETVDMSRRPTPAPVAATRPSVTPSYMDRFSSKLFQKIATTSAGRDLVYSPVSVHALLCMIYGVSVGKTFRELKEAGEFGEQIPAAMSFKELIDYKKGLGAAELTIATKVYYNRQLGDVNPGFPDFAQSYFSAGIEAVDMDQPKNTADQINAWVSDSTHKKIQNLISQSELSSRTEALLVNAIYFKGRWENEFATMDTLPYAFHHSDGSSSSVAMMYNDDIYGLADIPELDATVLELAYKGSGTSMLILLPKQTNGLANLERQLVRPEFDLNHIAARVRRQTVTVRIPKFRVEFEQDMSVPLQQLNVRQMFSDQSQIINMLNKKVRVEKVLQKAFIDVNEAGTEAAAASYAKFVPLSLPMKSPEFTADHPFVFAIRTASSVLFIGHVEHPTQMAP
ncbi:hypothetical protein KR054_005284, partial [Drosophila jambulina]